MTYYEKYLKYKKKYLMLQEQLGGICTICPKLGFHQNLTKQFEGTCSNDTMLLLILYSDDLGEDIQNIFNSMGIDLEQKITYDIFKKNYEKLINSDSDTKKRLNVEINLSDNSFFMPINIDEKDYDYFYEQGLLYLYNIFLRYDNDKKDILNPIKKLQRQLSFQENEACMNNLLNIVNINEIKKSSLPGNNKDVFLTICIFNYFLMNCKNKFINKKEVFLNGNNIDTIIKLKKLFTTSSNVGLYLKSNVDEKLIGHLNGFIKCNNIEYFYDNNGLITQNENNMKTTIEFQWKKKLISICDKIIDEKLTDKHSDIFTRELFRIEELKLNRYPHYIEAFLFIFYEDFINDGGDLYESNYFINCIINNIPNMTNYYSDEIYVIYERLIYYTNNNVLNATEDFWDNFWYYVKKDLLKSKNIKIVELLYYNDMISINQLLKTYLTSTITDIEFDDIINKYNDSTFDSNSLLFDLIDLHIDENINISLIKYLISNGADINYKNINNKTPLIYTIEKCLYDLNIVKKRKIINLIDYFITSNANLHIIDKQGKTAFEISIDQNDNINNVTIAKKIYEKDNTTFTNIKDKICKDKSKYKPLIKIFITNELCK